LGGENAGRMPPILQIFENARRNVPEAEFLEIVVRTDDAMEEDNAFALPDKQEVHVRQSFVSDALQDSPEARFLGVHELMHVVFHRGAPRFFRKNAGNVIYAFLHDKEKTAEWQADRIARAILMPPTMVASCKDALQLSQLAGVPLKEAARRTEELAERNRRSTPNDIAVRIATLASDASEGTPQFGRQKAELLKLQLWSALPTVDGEDKSTVRKCGAYQIFWNEFGKTTQCGWFIENGRIMSYFAMRSR
jgi:Zn-dependent peptidase ImmA (M78 family)